MDYYQTTNPSYGMAEASMASEGILFGEIRRRDKVVVFSLTGLTLLMLSACFVYGMVQPKRLINLFFTLCICMMSISELVIIFWYRRGELDPKFRYLICYNAICIIALCTCCLIFAASEN
ncbi:transmembrane protein 243-like [Symsagittifera roscoffensis]|uniref:transmembrane protein 243-like n=1 Tax=Symsagittifera roscoffensis TaxID=84072 RepID=UPI00307C3187